MNICSLCNIWFLVYAYIQALKCQAQSMQVVGNLLALMLLIFSNVSCVLYDVHCDEPF